MRKSLIAMTAASALALSFSTAAFAGNGNGNFSHNGNGSHNGNNSHNTAIIGSSLINLGGQNNGSHSVSGVLNDQNLTGNDSIQNNNAPAIVVVF